MKNKLTDESLRALILQNDESEILDYKENFEQSKQIGEYVSALGNSALMLHSPVAYLIWGVHDKTKKLVGTKFDPGMKVSSKNKMPFKTYLEQYLRPHINLYWDEHKINGKRIVALIIDVSRVDQPISFSGKRFIRVGTSKKSLSEFPEKERQIWEAFESNKFELNIAKEDLSYDELSHLINLDVYRDNLGLPDVADLICDSMLNDHLIYKHGSRFDITNLGAYTLALNMNNFPALTRRTIRITQYAGNQKLDEAVYDQQGQLGIIVAFENILKQIMVRMPYRESYIAGTRKDVPMFPEIAIRELVANALVHQDFTLTGMYPSVEIFKNKIVISNPGHPLIEPARFLDSQPISRNDELANLMQKFKLVESRGTGIDKVVNALEINQLPALDISVPDGRSTVITIRSKKPFKDLTVTERNNSIYWNACLKYVADEQISNKSIRDSFGLTSRDSSMVSKAISNAVEANLIKAYDPNLGKKFSKYIPFWGKDVLNN